MINFFPAEECSKIILRFVNANNCLSILEKVSCFAPEKLIRKIKGFSLWYFDDIVQTEAFDKLDVDRLERLEN